ncbi:MAG: HD domain-containing protein [Ardenticatenaceae bacterium]
MLSSDTVREVIRRLTPEELRPFIEARMTKDAAHDWHHIERVYRNGLAIASTEPQADEVVLRAALVLHDVGAKTIERGNALVDEALVGEILGAFGVAEEKWPAIVTAVNEHSFTRGAKPSTLEAAIVQDADRLDAIGAIGVARAFAYGGANHRALYSPHDPSNTIQHFDDKLFKLRDLMNTTEGRRLADQRHRFMEHFVAEFMKEWAGEA